MARKVDQLGRVVLPAETRRLFGIREGDLVEISVDGDKIVLSKLEERCVFCGSAVGLVEFSTKRVCQRCVAEIKSGRVGTDPSVDGAVPDGSQPTG